MNFRGTVCKGETRTSSAVIIRRKIDNLSRERGIRRLCPFALVGEGSVSQRPRMFIDKEKCFSGDHDLCAFGIGPPNLLHGIKSAIEVVSTSEDLAHGNAAHAGAGLSSR